MLFSSPAFFVFFLVYFVFHLLVPRRHRIFLIICGSTVFYAWWRLEYAWLPYLLMAIAYGGVVGLERVSGRTARKALVIATILALFLPLAVFKYTNFLYGQVLAPLFDWHGTLLELPLPLGISFVTFTLTAFVVDSYRGKFPAGQRASTVLAYVLFFPHLIAGPILRPAELIPQLERPCRATLRHLAAPVAIFTAGLVKKLVFADQIAQAVDAVYGSSGVSASSALLAIYGFGAQIYCDFSGYTDMAIGLALLLGVRLPNNFSRPYAADSLVEFWRCWHMTLSFWLRDYLYFPLGGNRHGRLRQVRNILITMTLGGLWHGAAWTFVFWGALHGVGVTAVHFLRQAPMHAAARAIPRWLGVVLTFHFVTFAWVLFRAPSLSKAAGIVAALYTGGWDDAAAFATRNAFVLALIVVFLALHHFDDHQRIEAAVRRTRGEILWPLLALLWVLAITVSHGSSAKFIYFDF